MFGPTLGVQNPTEANKGDMTKNSICQRLYFIWLQVRCESDKEGEAKTSKLIDERGLNLITH